MINKELYEMIFKRKSFHLFRNTGNVLLTEDEINGIYDCFLTLTPLNNDIKVKIKITNDTTCNRGQEYSICFYSEKKDNYLQNIGYLGEQLDLYLVKQNIATLWFGIGKVKEKVLDGLSFVIMIAIKKTSSPDMFRRDMFKSKRKSVSDIWSGPVMDIANIIRFAPSACNSQPWKVIASSKKLEVYRYKKLGLRGIMPIPLVSFYNQIDIGIFLCFIELCLEHENISFNRSIFIEDGNDSEMHLNAIYEITRK